LQSTNIAAVGQSTTGATDATYNITSLGAGYSVIESFHVVLGGGSATTRGQFNFSSHTNLTSSAPEPSSVALAFAGIAFAGVGAWRRRRKVAA